MTVEALFALNQQRPLLSVEKRQPRDHLQAVRVLEAASGGRGGGRLAVGGWQHLRLTSLHCCRGRSTDRLSCRLPSRGQACADLCRGRQVECRRWGRRQGR